jgi:hypothetical protein
VDAVLKIRRWLEPPSLKSLVPDEKVMRTGDGMGDVDVGVKRMCSSVVKSEDEAGRVSNLNERRTVTERSQRGSSDGFSFPVHLRMNPRLFIRLATLNVPSWLLLLSLWLRRRGRRYLVHTFSMVRTRDG